MTLEERLAKLQEQQKQAEVNFHQIAGAIAMVQQQIEESKDTDEVQKIQKEEKENKKK